MCDVREKSKKIVFTFYPFRRFFVFKKLQIYNLISQSMNQKPSLTYPLQFALLIGLMGAFLIISALIIPFLGSFLMHIPSSQVLKQIILPENADASRLLNTLASLLAFLTPAFILARLLSKRPFTQLGFNTTFNSRQFFLLVVITFASMILSGALGELNELIPIPAKWFAKAKELEESYKASMMVMATMKTQTDYLIALLVLAAAPAIFEEVLFRGGFQQVLIGWTNSKWKGIILTSVLFSVIHFSYFGFLPRVALGIVLGLVFYHSKNIWFNILLHFLNNAMVVTQLYIVSKQGKSINKTMDESMPIWWGAIALLVLLLLINAFKKESSFVLAKKEQAIHSSPENILS
jgi:membrane protease YdiL (CAAX protease family)